MAMDLSTIIREASTKDEVVEVVNQLEKVKAALYATEEQVLARVIDEEVSREVAEVVEPLIKAKTREAIAQEVDEMIDQLREMSVLHITLAIHPTRNVIRKIQDWLRDRAAFSGVISIDYDPQLMGGAIIASEGHYIDATVRGVFDKKAEEYQVTIREIFGK
jgi:F0F1-type ATP synthase delta subunit